MPGQARTLALLLAALVLAPACQVQRVGALPEPGPAELPSLRRASVALREQIQRERGHVEDYNRELLSLGRQEQRLYTSVLEAEEGVQRLQGDLEGVLQDREAMAAEVLEAEASRQRQLVELQRKQLELEAVQADLAAVQGALAGVQADVVAGQLRLLALESFLGPDRDDGRGAAASAGTRSALWRLGWWPGPGAPALGHLTASPLTWTLLAERSAGSRGRSPGASR